MILYYAAHDAGGCKRCFLDVASVEYLARVESITSEIFNRNFNYLCKRVFTGHRLDEDEDEESLAQDTLIKVFNTAHGNSSRYDPDMALYRTWQRCIAIRVRYDHINFTEPDDADLVSNYLTASAEKDRIKAWKKLENRYRPILRASLKKSLISSNCSTRSLNELVDELIAFAAIALMDSNDEEPFYLLLTKVAHKILANKGIDVTRQISVSAWRPKLPDERIDEPVGHGDDDSDKRSKDYPDPHKPKPTEPFGAMGGVWHRLDPIHRDALRLVYLEGFAPQEAAKRMGINRLQIYPILSAALHSLRTFL